MASREAVLRRMNRIARHVAGSEESEVPACHRSQLLPTNCSSTLNSATARCDNRLLFARQASAAQGYFMRQVSATQGLRVGGMIQQNSPSRSSCSRNGPPYHEPCGDPLFSRPAQTIPCMPTFKKQSSASEECVQSSSEPPRFARPRSGVCDKNQLSCNRVEPTARRQGTEWSPRMDVAETGQLYIVMLELPGANVIDITVEVNDRDLVVRGNHTAPRSRIENGSGIKNVTYIQRGICEGPYSVVWPIPSDVNKDAVSAELLNGFLQITLPKVSRGKSNTKM